MLLPEGLRQTLSQGREREGIYTRPDILMGCQAAIAGKLNWPNDFGHFNRAL